MNATLSLRDSRIAFYTASVNLMSTIRKHPVFIIDVGVKGRIVATVDGFVNAETTRALNAANDALSALQEAEGAA